MLTFALNPKRYYWAILIIIFGLLTSLKSEAADYHKRFNDNKDGTITDVIDGLVWIKNPEQLPELRGGKIWIKAKQTCEELVYAGKGPGAWRLPDIDELQGLLADSGNPRIDTSVFAAVSSAYWTSTDYTGPGSNAWVVDFVNGEISPRRKLSLISPELLRVRCVRNG